MCPPIALPVGERWRQSVSHNWGRAGGGGVVARPRSAHWVGGGRESARSADLTASVDLTAFGRCDGRHKLLFEYPIIFWTPRGSLNHVERSATLLTRAWPMQRHVPGYAEFVAAQGARKPVDEIPTRRTPSTVYSLTRRSQHCLGCPKNDTLRVIDERTL
jgi:hypothetical protein